MFDIFKRKTVEADGPFEFEHCIEIDRPAAEVYALIDWADARNAKRALGNKVVQVGESPDRFRMLLDFVPGHVFEMIVTEAVPGRIYAFENEITPPPGRLVSSHETYSVEPLGEGACRLSLLVSASFIGGLSAETLVSEAILVSVSCENALAKLKIQAEEGVDAVHAIEAQQMDCFGEG